MHREGILIEHPFIDAGATSMVEATCEHGYDYCRYLWKQLCAWSINHRQSFGCDQFPDAQLPCQVSCYLPRQSLSTLNLDSWHSIPIII
jgi:hypothetical protein